MATLIPAPPARDHTAIPIYKLYGYGNVWTAPDPLFCETIAAQEKLHNWHVAPHQHVDLLQLLHLESGQVTVRLDGAEHVLGPGHIVVVPQRVVHEFVFQPGSAGHILTLTQALLHPLGERFGLALGAHVAPAVLPLGERPEDRYVAWTLHRLDQEYRQLHSPQRGPLLESLLAVILVWVERRLRPAAPEAAQDPGSRHLARYGQLIEAHFSEQHQVAWYARRIGITPAHLNSVVQALTGKSALQLIHERLLLQARRELIYTPRSIALIADTLGFADAAYFTRFFKRMTGLAPRDFRRGLLHRTP